MKFGRTCHGIVWYCLVWFGRNSEAACRFRDAISGFREVIFGFWEAIWVNGFKIRWVGRSDGWVILGMSGGYLVQVGQENMLGK